METVDVEGRTSIDPRGRWLVGNRVFFCVNSDDPKVPRMFENTVLVLYFWFIYKE